MENRFKILALIAVVFLPIGVRADLATVYLTDGRTVTVDLVTVEQGQIQWKNPAKQGAPIESFLRSEIDSIDFTPSGAWKSAEEDFESGDFPAAVEGYKAVVADRSSHFYPMPGNFVSLAQVRILEIRRLQLDAKAVAEQFKKVRSEWTNLPPSYREVDPVTAAWIAVSEEKWQKVVDSLEQVESPGPETFYLRGRAAEALGRLEEAIQHYAGAYVLNFGGFSEVTKQSLRRSIDLLAKTDDKNRRAELQAQARLYRDLFGGGKLWADVPKWVAELADAEIQKAGAEIDGEKMESPSADKGTVVASEGQNATLPPKDDRDWLLPSEVDRKVYVINRPGDESVIENLGGAQKTPEGTYSFNGTGSGIKFRGLDGRAKMWVMKTIFTPAAKDGAFFDLTQKDEGGFGFYLREGKFFGVWKPAESEATEVEFGEITPGKEHVFFFRVTSGGSLRGHLDESEPIDVEVGKNGLGLGAKVAGCLGDTRSSEEDQFAADGKNYIPFEGTVEFFAIGYGDDWDELHKSEMTHFGDKRVRLRPPEPEEPETKTGE